MSTRLLAAAVTAVLLLLTGSADAADKKVIRLWQTETEPQTMAVLNQIAADYEKKHPNVSIKIERRPGLPQEMSSPGAEGD